MKRLVIYFHYDPAGRIDTACRIAVQAMQKYAKVLFVTNGTLTPADRVWVRQMLPTKAAQASIAMGYSRRHLCQICAGTLRTVVCCICCCAAKKPDIMKNRIVSQPNTYSVWNRSGATKKLTPEKPTPAICW